MPVDRQDLRVRLAALAAEQSGYFTAGQARDLGYDYPAQKYHADRGNWQRVDRGIYRIPFWPIGEHDSLVRWSLWARGRGVVSHDTALSVWHLGDANPARVHLTVPANFRATAPGVRIHRGEIEDPDVADRGGYRMTTPLRTILDTAAAGAVDLLGGAIDDGLHHRRFTERDIRARADEFGPAAALAIERALGRLADRR